MRQPSQAIRSLEDLFEGEEVVFLRSKKTFDAISPNDLSGMFLRPLFEKVVDGIVARID